MKNLEDYKRRVKKIDRELKLAIDKKETSRNALAPIQLQLDSVADDYSIDSVGKYFYKAYEIQAYLHFLREELSEAEKFINEAVRIRERNYYDADALIQVIKSRKAQRDAYITSVVKQKAIKQLTYGIGILVVGIVITGISYTISQHNAEQQAINNGQSQYSFSYTAASGAILFGGVYTILGLVKLGSYKQEAKKLIRKLND